MKDKDFEELLNHQKLKPTEIKMINTNKKNSVTRNAQSRLRSTEKSFIDDKLEPVNKKFFRAQSSSFKFFQPNNKIKKENEKPSQILERKSTIVKPIKKK